MNTPAEYETLLKNQYLHQPVNVQKYSSLFERTHGIYIAIGSVPQLQKLNIEDSRRFIAANGIASAHDVRTPTRGGEYTLNRSIHFIINVDATLNYGKQNIPNKTLIGWVNNFYEDAYRSTLRNIAKNIVGTPAEGSSTGAEVSEETPSVSGILQREDLPLSELSIRKVPYNEDTLVALFFELVGKGYLPGYRTYTMYRTARYDGKMILRLEGRTDWREPATDSDLDTVEFKLRTLSLIKDFEDGLKLAQDVRLIIVWENNFENNVDYQVVDIEHTDDADRRLPHVKYCLQNRRTGRLIQMLVLKEVIDEIVAFQSTT